MNGAPTWNTAAWEHVDSVQVDRDAEEALGTFGEHVASMRPNAVVDLLCFTVPSCRQLLEALVPIGSYLLHCGTIWVHGSAVEVPVSEDVVRRPVGDYGVQKAAIEELLLDEARRGTVRCTVLHPGHIVGPGWVPVNPVGNTSLEVFNRLAKGEDVALPNFGLETVHHVHADDVAQAFVKALAHPAAASGESFHVVSGHAVTLRGYAESVAKWFGQPARLSFQPWETWAAARDPADAQVTWEHIIRSPSMSIDKAVKILGYRPRFSSLEAIFESLMWLVDNGKVDTAGRRPAF